MGSASTSGVIFRSTITLPDGTVLRAQQYGLKAFPIRIGNADRKRRRRRKGKPGQKRR